MVFLKSTPNEKGSVLGPRPCLRYKQFVMFALHINNEHVTIPVNNFDLTSQSPKVVNKALESPNWKDPVVINDSHQVLMLETLVLVNKERIKLNNWGKHLSEWPSRGVVRCPIVAFDHSPIVTEATDYDAASSYIVCTGSYLPLYPQLSRN